MVITFSQVITAADKESNHSRIEYVFAFCAFLLFCCFAFKSLVNGKINIFIHLILFLVFALEMWCSMFNHTRLTWSRVRSTSNCHHVFRKDIFLLNFMKRPNLPIWYIFEKIIVKLYLSYPQKFVFPAKILALYA